jgi:hypothetical protein
MDIVMILKCKCAAFLFAAFALAGCCVSGNGCSVPSPAGTPLAWDGLGSPPAENEAEQKPKRASRPKTDVVGSPMATAQADHKSQAQDRWAREEAEDRNADAKLAKQLMICRSC